MASLMEIMQLCRLCLVKDQVNIPIFEEQGDIRQIFLKISACLPVKVSREDNLPKKICDGCSYKLEILYQFWNTSANSEKQLLKWLSQIGVEKNSTEKVAVTPAQPHSSLNSDGVVLKQEIVDLADTHSVEELAPDDLDDSNDAQDYILQQQQLPYQPFQFQQDGFTDGEATASASTASATITSETVEAAPKRKRRAAAMKALPPHIDSEEEDEDDVDMVETKIAKTEEQSDDSGAEDPEPTAFVGLPSTSTDNEQPGPSGVGKGSTEAPKRTRKKNCIDALFSTKENWSNRLPEIDIFPVIKQEEYDLSYASYENDHSYSESSVNKRKSKTPKKKVLRKNRRSLTEMGYKNPFNYSNCDYTKKILDFKPVEAVTNKWSCIICNEITPDKQSLIDHYEQHKNEKETTTDEDQPQSIQDYFKCVVCTREFTSARSYEKHLEHKHGENSYACERCDKTYKNSFQLCLHNFNVHSENGKYKCIACDFSTGHRASLKSHIQKHESDYKFQCDICDKKFFTATWFEEHKNSHTGAMPFQCEICLKSFPYSRFLVAHKKSVHPQEHTGSRAINKCEVCAKQFAHRKSLILHVRSHTGENTVLCDMCGKRLSSTEHLKQHLRIHTGYKPHICAVCGKGFAKKSNLTLHERVHSGEKPYVCKECSKCFSQRSTLVIHERYHSGERPYSCPLCKKGFVAKGLLGVHLKSCSRIPQ